jgi:hypothetical protein
MTIWQLWENVVREYAAEAARDPVRRLARLELPPMIENAATNAKWHEADLRYRQARHQLEAEIRDAGASSVAAWRTASRFIYSPNTLAALINVAAIYFVLYAFGIVERVEWGLRDALKDLWIGLGGRHF